MTMELNELRTLITLLSFIVFAGIVFWAYSGKQKARFEEAANLPFIDDELPAATSADASRKGGRE